jgi:hypothetical protein
LKKIHYNFEQPSKQSIMDTNNTSNDISNISFSNHTYHLPHEQFFLVLNHMTLYVLPVEIVLGCLGNMVAFYVLVTSHLIQQSCNVYLAFLTLVDTGFLLCTFFVWIDFILPTGVFSMNGFCQGIPYLTYVFSFLSGYTVLSFTVERFIVTFYPLHRQQMCTTRRAKLVVGGLTIFGLFFYSFPLYMSTVVKYEGYQECRPLIKFTTAATILSSIDSVLTLLLPAFIIIILNMAIAVKIARIFSAKSRLKLGQCHAMVELRDTPSNTFTRQTSLQDEKPPRFFSFRGDREKSSAKGSFSTKRPLVPQQSNRSSSTHSRISNGSSSKSQARTTRTLIVLSSLFVLLKLPSHALRLHTFIHSFLSHPRLTHSDTMWLLAWQELCQFVYYLNFAGNFFLYCLVSTVFRSVAMSKLKAIAKCCKPNLRRL